MAKTTKQDLDNIKAVADATGKGLSDAIGKVTELNGLTGTLSSYFSGISDSAFEFAGAMTKAEESTKNQNKTVGDAVKLAELRAKLQQQLATNADKLKDIEKELGIEAGKIAKKNHKNRLAEEQALDRKYDKLFAANTAQEAGIKRQLELIELEQQLATPNQDISALKSQQAEKASQIKELLNEINNTTEVTVDQTTKLAKLRGEQLAIENAIKAEQTEQNQQLQKGLGHITKFIGGIGAAAQGFLGLERQTLAVQKNLSTTNDEAEKFRKQSVEAAGGYLSMDRSIRDMLESQKEYTDLYGTTLGMSEELLGNTVDLATRLGTTTQSAGAAFQAMQGMTGASDDQTMALQTNLGLLAKTAKVPVDKVFQDMATASAEATRFLSGGGKAVAKMAVQARQLGLSLNDVAKVAEGLLNIEQSLGSEMELQVMTGKNLNFAGAREMALRGDILGATKAIRQQVGDINNLNYLQIASLEEATGLSIKQLRTMDRQESVLDNMTKEEREQIELAMEKYGVDDLAQAQQALAAEAQVNMAKQLENLTNNISTLISGPMGWVAGAVQFAGSLAQVAMALNTIKAIEISTAIARITGMSVMTGGAALAIAGTAALGAAAYFASDISLPASGNATTGDFGSMIPQRGANRKAILDGDAVIHLDPRDDVAAAPGLAEMLQSETPIQSAVVQNTANTAQSTRASGTAAATESPLMQQMVKLLTELVANSRNPIPAVISEKGIGELNRSIIAQNQRRTQFDNTYGRTV